ncbi:hypothetical protein PENTCL1PPCAC_11288 [Pristionchus entomophagus]|uniref:Calpain catalytic domain-containing protein n=1 Tax=Pristionchus entomophagus TaxID=358040 RepID=A0AAV5T8G6_9BILA|nr:hypothetical protein PENTCL1PPCAC_11288 [Pristionchus entomophagus]
MGDGIDAAACRAATNIAQKAIAYDNGQRYEEAIYFYMEAANRMLDLLSQKKMVAIMKNTVREYIERAEFLKRELPRLVASVQASRSPVQISLEKAEFCMIRALDLDEKRKPSDAKSLYEEAIHLCLEAVKMTGDAQMQQKLTELARRGLERAEALVDQVREEEEMEMLNKLPTVPDNDAIANLRLDDRVPPPCGKPSSSISAPPSPSVSKRGEGLTKDETALLGVTSKINGRLYVPFHSKDLKEKFSFIYPFTDKDGFLSLTEKQKKRLKGWMRPSEFMEDPAIIRQIDSGTIKQTVVSDCSFVSSLTIAARYERRFGKQLVTSIIFPQNSAGQPIYNSDGKYMVKMHINGIWRKIIIDDYLPVDERMVLMCSHSQSNELWVTLLEKAYLKVMGGYDFPGSNSNIDLHALTGWIPERISIKGDKFEADKIFDKLLTRFHRGDCLITLATGKIPDEEAKRAGLVDCHAYALLDLRKLGDKRLLMVKNPWTHLRWKGRFSENDKENWTEERKKALEYDPDVAQEKDDGVFWIEYESVIHFFDVFYVNWNPAIFAHTTAIHNWWNNTAGPVKDLYSVAANPQYRLEVNNPGPTAVWILLTRHITDLADFAENKEYITVLVYKGGKKVYLPFDPKPLYDGTRINSPHYLCQMVITDPGPNKFTLLVAQYEKTKTIYYTLRVYSQCQFSLSPIGDQYTVKKKETGEWKGKTAGGHRETFENNPLYHLSLEEGSDDHSILIDLRGPKEYSIAFQVCPVSFVREGKEFYQKETGLYRAGYTVMTLDGLAAGTYSIRPSTFITGQEGPFFLGVESTKGFTLKRVQ